MTSFLIAGALAVLVHELGHAVAQYLLGVPVERVVWGAGPRICRLGVLEIRMIPWSGYVTPVGALLARQRWQRVLIALSGILATWVVVLVMILTQAVRVWWLKDFCVWWLFWSFVGLLQLLPVGQRDGRWALVAVGLFPPPAQKFSTLSVEKAVDKKRSESDLRKSQFRSSLMQKERS